MSKKKQTKKRKLSLKQKKFADEYIETGNATEAYINAGYKINTNGSARTNASRTLTKANVKAYIDEQMRKIEDSKIMKASEAIQGLTAIARGEAKSKAYVGDDKDTGQPIYREIFPTVTERYRAYESILKRYPLSDLDKAQIKRAQAEAIKAETEAKLAQQQIDDHDTASGVVVDALKDMPKEEIIKLARKVGSERNASNTKPKSSN